MHWSQELQMRTAGSFGVCEIRFTENWKLPSLSINGVEVVLHNTEW